MKTLVIIDFQKDFANNKGTLYVPGAERAEKAIIKYIIENHKEISDIVFTVDWHSPNHCSFKKNGGLWPNHCIQFTEGAGISDKIMNTCLDYNIKVKVFKKGNVDDCEEYGAFDSVSVWGYDNGDFDIVVNNLAGNNTLHFDISNIVVCGLAGDYCVKETIKNLLNRSVAIWRAMPINIEVLKDGVASIDGGRIFNDFINENKLKTI